jgi:tRNA (mo5U34)-methyltransferase
MDVEEIKREVAKIAWWHRIDLGHGIITPGVNDSPAKLRRLAMPENLRGLSVLDIGAWDGFYSFEAERRGADRVVATDSFAAMAGGASSPAAFLLAKRVLNSRVEHREVDVLDLSPSTVGVFDVVLFLGVLYHLRSPLLALERVFHVTKRLLILETHVDLFSARRPAMIFYPGAELNRDPTNWWGPNPPAVIRMLEAAGFRTVQEVSRDTLAERLRRAAKVKARGGGRFLRTLRQGRIVVHARP